MTDYFKDLAAGVESQETKDLYEAYKQILFFFLAKKNEAQPLDAEKIIEELQKRITAAGVQDLTAVYKRARNIFSHSVYALNIATLEEAIQSAAEKKEAAAYKFTHWDAKENKAETIKIVAPNGKDGSKQAREEMAARYPDAVEIPQKDFMAANYMLWYGELARGADEEEPAFSPLIKMVSTPVVNVLTEMKRSTIDQKREEISAAGRKVILDNGKGLTLSIPIEKYNEAALKDPNTDKLFKQIVLNVAKTKERTFYISGKDFMKARGLKDSKEAQKQAREALTALAIPLIEYDGGKMGSVDLDHIVGTAKMRGLAPGKGKEWYIAGELGLSVYSHIIDASDKYIKQFPPELFTIPNNKKPEYIIANAFIDARRYNAGEKNENTLSVKALLERCPMIPTYESLPELGYKGQARQRIINPFIKALEYLENEKGLFTYRFQEPGGKLYKNGRFEAWENDYSKFISLMVAVEWKEPYTADQAHLIEQKEKRAKQAAARKRKSQQKEK